MAGISGLFKSFIDLLDNDLLIAKPLLLAATAGSSRHALVEHVTRRSKTLPAQRSRRRAL